MYRKSTILTLASMLAVAASAAAVPPELAWTKQEDALLCHIDFERLVDSAFKSAIERPFRLDDEKDQVWRKVLEALPLTIGEDIRSATFHSVGPLEEDIVLIVRMSERADLIPGVLEKHIPGYRVTEIDGYRVHSWAEIVEEARRHIYGHLSEVGEDERMWIISTNWEHLLETLAFAEGKVQRDPTFGRPGGPSPPSEHSAVYLYIPVDALRDRREEKMRPELEKVEWIIVDLAATAERCGLLIAAALTEEQDAKELAQFAQGMLALTRMMSREDESLRPAIRLLEHVRFHAEDRVMRLELSAAPEMFGEALEAMRLWIGTTRRTSGRFSIDVGTGLRKPANGSE